VRRPASSQAPGLVTRGRIAADIEQLGVAAGDVVMLHAAVSAIGWIVGGPDQVLHGVFDALGERGTLMMYVGWDGSPYDVTLGLPALPPELADVWPAYDPSTAHAVRSWGVLAEVLRRWPGARRSGHPDGSFAAVGPLAEELVADHPLQYGMGEGSPLAKLCEAGGKLLLLGSLLEHVTLLHYAEHVADVPEKGVVHYWAPILRDGRKEWVEIEEFDTNGCLPWHGPTDLFEAIVRDHLQEGRGTVGPVGLEERYVEPVERHVTVEVETAGPGSHHEVLALFEAMEAEAPGTVASKKRLSTRVDEFLEDPNRAVFLARIDGKPVGVLVAVRASRERGILEQAYVDPSFRRLGVLREMEIDASGYLREAGCSSVHVHVGVRNAAGRAAWRSLGYTPSAEFLERPL
jgi:aminoglycoside 3-N-acetyltransferase